MSLGFGRRSFLSIAWYASIRVRFAARIAVASPGQGPGSRHGGRSPWAIFTAGGMGVGKGYTIRYLADRGVFQQAPGEHQRSHATVRRMIRLLMC